MSDIAKSVDHGRAPRAVHLQHRPVDCERVTGPFDHGDAQVFRAVDA